MVKYLDVGSNSLQLDERDDLCRYVSLFCDFVELAAGGV